MRESDETPHPLSEDLARLLGTNRVVRLRRVMRRTQLPAEAVLDLALKLVELAARDLLRDPIGRTAVGLGAARWRDVSPEERSKAMSRTANARWHKGPAGSGANAAGEVAP